MSKRQINRVYIAYMSISKVCTYRMKTNTQLWRDSIYYSNTKAFWYLPYSDTFIHWWGCNVLIVGWEVKIWKLWTFERRLHKMEVLYLLFSRNCNRINLSVPFLPTEKGSCNCLNAPNCAVLFFSLCLEL